MIEKSAITIESGLEAAASGLVGERTVLSKEREGERQWQRKAHGLFLV